MFQLAHIFCYYCYFIYHRTLVHYHIVSNIWIVVYLYLLQIYTGLIWYVLFSNHITFGFAKMFCRVIFFCNLIYCWHRWYQLTICVHHLIHTCMHFYHPCQSRVVLTFENFRLSSMTIVTYHSSIPIIILYFVSSVYFKITTHTWCQYIFKQAIIQPVTKIINDLFKFVTAHINIFPIFIDFSAILYDGTTCNDISSGFK